MRIGLNLFRALDQAFDKLLSVTGTLAIVLMLLLSGLVFLLTVSRYVFRINLPGLFDGAVYSLIAFPFLMAAYTMREGQHIAVDVLTSRLPERTRSILSIAVHLMSLLYIIILGWQGARWAANLFRDSTRTPGGFQIPKGLLVSIIILGCLLLTVQIIRVVIHNIRTLPSQTSSSRLRDSPWLGVSLFAIGIIISLVLFVYASPLTGIILLALVILFSGMPIFLALGLLGCLGIYFVVGPRSLIQIPITVYASLDSFPLTCLPLFILGGLIMERSGIAEDMFRFFELFAGRSPISPLLVTITLGMVFCAISGSSSATTAVVAAVAMPILIKRGFDKGLSCGVVIGATVGSLIPPSIGYVIYGVITDESIAALFMATLLPALVLFTFYYLYVIILARVSKKSLFENGQIPARIEREKATWRDRLSILKTAVWGLLAPVIIIGGIYFGIYTPTEAAGTLVIYSIVLAVFIKRTSWRAILKGTLKSATISAMILCIVFSAYTFSLVISQLRLSSSLVAYAKATGMTANAWLGIIFMVLLTCGMFMDAAPMKLIFLPLFYAPAMAAGINSLWLGVFWQFMGEIALITPPVGLCVFVLHGITGIPLDKCFRGTFPFLIMMLLTLVVMYFFPQLVTWLPGTMK